MTTEDVQNNVNLSINNNIIFIKVLSDKKICKGFIKRLLNIEVDQIEFIEIEKTINTKIDNKSIRLDLLVRIKDKFINIEMQVARDKDLALWSRFYQSTMDINNLQKGQTYDELKNLLIYIKHSDIKNGKFVKLLDEKVNNFKEKKNCSYENMYLTACMMDAKREGIREGETIGIKKYQIIMVKKLLKIMSIEKVLQNTELSIEEIKKLVKDH